MKFELVLLGLLPLVIASKGDKLPAFTKCLRHCSSFCEENNFYETTEFEPVSFPMKLLFWDCKSNCDYQCQQIVTKSRISQGQSIEQFHGKWPFKRLFGAQEFLSAIFSLLNFIPHYINTTKSWNLYKRHKRETEEGGLKVLYFNVYLVSVITSFAWFFSTIFHIRDVNLTEKLDYYFAGLTVLSAFHYLIIRTYKLHNNRSLRNKFSIVCALMFIYHIGRLTYSWSYTYNMQANLILAMFENGLFAYLGYQHYKAKNFKVAKIPIVMISWVLVGLIFEVFDFFSNSTQLDAHSLWHAVTIVPGFYLYEFFYQDIETLRGYID